MWGNRKGDEAGRGGDGSSPRVVALSCRNEAPAKEPGVGADMMLPHVTTKPWIYGISNLHTWDTHAWPERRVKSRFTQQNTYL